MERYYYKKDNNYLSLKHSLEIITEIEDGLDEEGNTKYKEVRSLPDGYIQITKEEFEEHNKIPEPTAEQKAQIEKENRIRQLKSELATYDYIGVKIAMGVATKEEYAKEIAYTETLRAKIRELER